MSAKSPSPPPSPRTSSVRLSLYNISQAIVGIQRIRKSKSIVSSSGPEPITHAALSGTLFQKKVHVLRVDEFICESGVDAPKLLRACRSTLLEQAQKMGANALVDEEYIKARRASNPRSCQFFTDGKLPLSPQRIPWVTRTKLRLDPTNYNDFSTCYTNPLPDPIRSKRDSDRQGRPSETRCPGSGQGRSRAHDNH